MGGKEWATNKTSDVTFSRCEVQVRGARCEAQDGLVTDHRTEWLQTRPQRQSSSTDVVAVTLVTALTARQTRWHSFQSSGHGIDRDKQEGIAFNRLVTALSETNKMA